MPEYEISYTNKATINIGNFENLQPLYSVKKKIETPVPLSDDVLEEHYIKLQKLIDKLLENNIRSIKTAPKRDVLPPHIRVEEKEGKQYIHVTDIINPQPFCGNQLYGERGTRLHRILQKLIELGNYEFNITDTEEKTYEGIGGIRKFDFKWILDLGLDFRSSETEVWNEELLTVGRYDADGFYKGELCMFDLKSGKPGLKQTKDAFMQMACYIKSTGRDYQNMVIIPIHPEANKQLIMTNEIDKYYDMFKEKRSAFRDKYGL